jgi:hypothetical protein
MHIHELSNPELIALTDEIFNAVDTLSASKSGISRVLHSKLRSWQHTIVAELEHRLKESGGIHSFDKVVVVIR